MKHKILLFASILTLIFAQSTEEIKKQIKASGMSEVEIREQLKQRGYSDEQIKEEAARRGIDLEEGTGQTPQTPAQPVQEIPPPAIDPSITDKPQPGDAVVIPGAETPGDIIQKELEIITDQDLEIIDEDELVLETEPQPGRSPLTYFGYDIFQRDPALFQSSTFGAVDPDYNIGPGDEIIIMLWGETQFRQVFTVDREGFIFIPEIGQVFVNGLTLNLLESKLFRVLSQSYASLNPNTGKPTTFLDISLGNLRPLRILVLGDVAQPGAYTVSPSTTLFSSLYFFSGPTTNGSLRNIQLIRGGEKVATVDFYSYLLSGEKINDVRLQLDDTIFIPSRIKTISISGEVIRPAIYELKKNEGLKELIEIAGGLKTTAYIERAQIDRIVPFKEREELGMDRMFVDVNLEDILFKKKNVSLKDGDRIQVLSIMDLRKNIVTISGSVERPGSYDIGDSLRLSELITKSEGLLGDAYLDRIDIVRIKPDFSEQLIKLNLQEIINLNPYHDILLQGLDRVRVYSLTEMIPRQFISIAGHVKRPGQYPLLEDMTLYDLIFKAGGFIDEDWRKRVYAERAELVRVAEDSVTKEIIPFNLAEVLNKSEFSKTKLKPDDQIIIYSLEEMKGSTKYISISGHVKRPGTYELYEENMTLYDLLFKTGGFDDVEFKNRLFVERGDLIRKDENGITQTIIPFNIGEVLDNQNSPQNFPLLPGDEIRVYSNSMFNSVKPVAIEGVVKNPGEYTLKTGMTIKDLILETGGLSENVYRYKLEIARIDPENDDEEKYAEIISLDMDNDFSISNVKYQYKENPGELVVKRDEFKLFPYDHIFIRPDPHFHLQRKVNVSGAVYYPGDYAIIQSGEKVSDILKRAGGLRPEAYPKASALIRGGQTVKISFYKLLKNPKSKDNFEVIEGDQIIVIQKPNVIHITGEVNSPGIYKYYPNMRLKDYINRAGGLTINAERNSIWVEYPWGQSKRMRRGILPSPKVADGSVIIVGAEEEKEPFDKTEFAKEVASIMADIAQVIAILILAKPG